MSLLDKVKALDLENKWDDQYKINVAKDEIYRYADLISPLVPYFRLNARKIV